jgi:4a-hydroxytetrahydrobiopterin dehydratase
MNLTERKCTPCNDRTPRLDAAQVQLLLPDAPGWQLADDGRKLRRRFEFADFRQAMAFVVAMALVAEGEDHHPDFAVHYRDVEVTLWTHTIGGVSENDLIVAAKLSALVSGLPGRPAPARPARAG